MKKLALVSSLFVLPLLIVANEEAEAGTCKNTIEKQQQKIFKRAQDACAKHDKAQKENNPFIYVNPDGGCDLGLELPGLPSFGAGLGDGLDLCALAKTITGPMVKDVNKVVKDAKDRVVDDINAAAKEKIDTGVLDTDIDLSDMANDAGEDYLKENNLYKSGTIKMDK